MDLDIVQRQIVVFNADLAVQGNNFQNVPIDLRFPPDYLIVREIASSFDSSVVPAPATRNYIGLVLLDIAMDNVIGSFIVSAFSSLSSPNTVIQCRPNFYGGNVHFQLNLAPRNGTGLGVPFPFNVLPPENPFISVTIEFVQIRK